MRDTAPTPASAPFMNTIICAALGASAFFFSAGLGEAWPAAWVAAAPLLWLAYGDEPRWQVALASFAAFAIGQLNLLEAYAQYIPLLLLVGLFAVAPAAIFAAAILFARFAERRLPPWLAVFAFPALWTSLSYINSLISPNGSFGSPAYSQIAAPFLAQSASLFGLWPIVFLICLFSSALALVLRKGKRAWVAGVIALVLVGANAAYGVARLNEPQAATARVGLAVNDAITPYSWEDNSQAALAATTSYADAARALAKKGATVVVLPEKFAVLRARWRQHAIAPLADAARESGATIVAGFTDADEKRNIALTFTPDGKVASYAKRHMVPGGIEPLIPGSASGYLDGGRAVVICKDMDFQRTIRADAQSHIQLLYVPAWDFDADGWMHARMAIMRGIENGFAIARAAKHGLLTISDAEGRMIARAPSNKAGMVTLIADAPLGPGDTLYLRIGDMFAWACVGLFAGLGLVAILRRKSVP